MFTLAIYSAQGVTVRLNGNKRGEKDGYKYGRAWTLARHHGRAWAVCVKVSSVTSLPYVGGFLWVLQFPLSVKRTFHHHITTLIWVLRVSSRGETGGGGG